MTQTIKARKVRDTALPLKYREGDGGIDVALPAWGFPSLTGVDSMFPSLTGEDSIKIPLGWAFECPPGWHLLALQKSRHAGRFLVEAPLIDNSYRGEIHACLTFLGYDNNIILRPGDYILQLLPVWSPPFIVQETTQLSETTRGGGNFGSTMET